MNVYASQTRDFQDLFRQDQTVCHDHHQVNIKVLQYSGLFRALQRRWLMKLNSVLQGQLLDGTLPDLPSSAGRTVRLRIYGPDFMARIDKHLQGRCCKIRSTGKDDLIHYYINLLEYGGTRFKRPSMAYEPLRFRNQNPREPRVHGKRKAHSSERPTKSFDSQRTGYGPTNLPGILFLGRARQLSSWPWLLTTNSVCLDQLLSDPLFLQG